MLDLTANHASFVITAYALSAAVLALMVIVTVLRARRHRDKTDEQ